MTYSVNDVVIGAISSLFGVSTWMLPYENFAPMTCDTVKVTVSDPSYKAFTSEYGILSNFKYSRGKYRLFKRKF